MALPFLFLPPSLGTDKPTDISRPNFWPEKWNGLKINKTTIGRLKPEQKKDLFEYFSRNLNGGTSKKQPEYTPCSLHVLGSYFNTSCYQLKEAVLSNKEYAKYCAERNCDPHHIQAFEHIPAVELSVSDMQCKHVEEADDASSSSESIDSGIGLCDTQSVSRETARVHEIFPIVLERIESKQCAEEYLSREFLHDRSQYTGRTYIASEDLEKMGIPVFSDVPVVGSQEYRKFLATLADGGSGIGVVMLEKKALELANSAQLRSHHVHGDLSQQFYVSEQDAAAFNDQYLTDEISGIDTDSDDESACEGAQSSGSKSTKEDSTGKAVHPGKEHQSPHRGNKAGYSLPVNAVPAKTAPNPTVHGIILAVCVFLISILDKMEAIFESFRLNTKDDRFGWFESAFGTERRSQLKADKIKEPVRLQDESLDSFMFRMAGFCFFQLFLQEIFQDFANLIPASFEFSRYYGPTKAAALNCCALEGFCPKQDIHADKEPFRLGSAVSILCNVSSWFSWFDILLNSAKNISTLTAIYNRDFNAFRRAIHAHFKGQKGTRNLNHLLTLKGKAERYHKYRMLWNCYLNVYVEKYIKEFEPMELASLEMAPLSAAFFVMDYAHGGGEYPGKIPRKYRKYATDSKKRKRGRGIATKKTLKPWTYRYGRLHFR